MSLVHLECFHLSSPSSSLVVTKKKMLAHQYLHVTCSFYLSIYLLSMFLAEVDIRVGSFLPPSHLHLPTYTFPPTPLPLNLSP